MGDVDEGSGAIRPVVDARRHGWHSGVRGTLRRVGRVLAAVLSFTLLLGFGYGWYQYRSLDAGLQRLPLTNLGRPAAGATDGAARPKNGREQNILIVGLDSRNGLSAAERRLLRVGNADSLSTDTVMVVHVPADGSRATMISIPRDSYVDIHGYLKNKINAAYADAYGDAIASGATDKQAQTAG